MCACSIHATCSAHLSIDLRFQFHYSANKYWLATTGDHVQVAGRLRPFHPTTLTLTIANLWGTGKSHDLGETARRGGLELGKNGNTDRWLIIGGLYVGGVHGTVGCSSLQSHSMMEDTLGLRPRLLSLVTTALLNNPELQHIGLFLQVLLIFVYRYF